MYSEDYEYEDEFAEMYEEDPPIVITLTLTQVIVGDGFVIYRDYSQSFVW